MLKQLLQIFCPFLFTLSLFAQNSPAANEGRAILVDINYGVALPGGDMADRFGVNFDAGLGVEMLRQNNWIFGFGGGFIFGNQVDDLVLKDLATEGEGFIIGSNATFADVNLRERGFHAEARLGKLIPLLKTNKRSGIRAVLGLGFLQHKIRLQEDPQSFVPQILGDFKKGYDRLSNGFMVSEFIGYQHLSRNKLINFYAGFELTQAFTQNRRDYDFATQQESDKSTRTDLLYGFKVGWILPFYISKKNAESIRY